MQRAILILVVVVAVAVIGWALWPSGEPKPEPAPQPQAVEQPAARQTMAPAEPAQPAPEPAERPEPELVLPPLAQSDAFVRERLEPMNLPETWLDQDDYVRRLAVLAENAQRGEYPRRQLAFLEPRGPFKVVERGDRVFVDPVSYRRYDASVEALTAVDPANVAQLLGTIDPLVEAALREIGVEAPAGEVFESAMAEVMAVPELEGDGSVELVQPNVMYEYANPQLEALSPLQKQVLRMGPDNVRRLKAYLRRLAGSMGIELKGQQAQS